MLLWPAVAALGFVALTAVIIALGTSSTARYEFERDRAGGLTREQPHRSAVPRGRVSVPQGDDATRRRRRGG